MVSNVRSPKDFWIGAIYLVAGVVGLLIARDYSFGSAGRMGPGYFPAIISALLILFGAVSVLRAFLVPGGPVGALNWKGIVLITGSVFAFGVLLQTAGLVIALLTMVLVSAAASERFRFEWRAGLALIALIVFCVLVFVRGLGVPMPLVGEWFQSAPSEYQAQ
jgi:Tripartite tricarboxylate transporter TctB family